MSFVVTDAGRSRSKRSTILPAVAPGTTQPVSPVAVVVFVTSVVTDEVKPRVRPKTP